MDEDEDWWDYPTYESGAAVPGVPDVDWFPPEPIGWLYVTDDLAVPVFAPQPKVGFARFLEDSDGFGR
jgi:hypothetical protein